ncbi:MAG TPA: hypothetical protein VG675_01310 [Bryobacteraceae bacterium]|nr:hypothetical protein [Bryobacteraceae bacterium]
MSGSTTKKAVIRRFDREPLAGYINPISFLQSTGVELLSAEGNVAIVPYSEIKLISFVRDFDSAGPPERQVFHTRPKMEGLWISFRLRDGEVMEGVMPNNLLQVETHGFSLIPPDPYSNNQRIFVPRAALQSIEVLGVVGSPLKKRKSKAAPREQIGLFDEPS